MSDQPAATTPADIFAAMVEAPQKLFAQFMPGGAADEGGEDDPAAAGQLAQWSQSAKQMQELWLGFQREQMSGAASSIPAMLTAPDGNLAVMQSWLGMLPCANPEVQQKLWADSLALWEGVLGQYGIGPRAAQPGGAAAALPRSDRRFKDPQWRAQPFYALVHQTYLLLAEQIMALADKVPGADAAKTEQLRFAARTLVEALSPANFPLTNPLVMERAIATKGDSLVKGMEHLLGDIKRGQLTHVDPAAFRVGENIATAPGKVIHETPLYQLIQYSPATEQVLEVPLVIFPPWINRFYILDLSPEKSHAAKARWRSGEMRIEHRIGGIAEQKIDVADDTRGD